MARHLEPRHSRKPAREPRETVEPPPESDGRWWNRVTKGIVGAGAIATAITAIVTLLNYFLPGDTKDPVDLAELTSVEVHPVLLSEYEQRVRTRHLPEERTAGLRPWGAAAELPWDRQIIDPAAMTEQPGQDDQPTADPDEGDTDPLPGDTDPLPGDTGLSPAPPPPDEPASPPAPSPWATFDPASPPAVQTEPPRELIGNPEGVVEEACGSGEMPISQTDCFDGIEAIKPIASSFLKEEGGNSRQPSDQAEVAEQRAARRLVEVFKETRKRDGEPDGVVLTVDVKLEGLQNKPVVLSWEMWNRGDGTRLHGEWLNRNLAYRLVAKSERTSASLTLWVPLPPAPGPYFVRSHLLAGETALDSHDSKSFD